MADQARLQIVIDAISQGGGELDKTVGRLKDIEAAASKAGLTLKDFGGSADDAVVSLLKTEAASRVMDEAKTAVAGMSEEEKVARLAADELAQAENKAGQEATGASKEFRVMGLSLTDINSGVALAKQGLQTLKQVWDFGKQGAENQRVAASFEETAASVGVNAEAMATALDKAAKGTVDDEVYMQTATRNMALGVATSVQDNVAIMELARAASVKFGGDTETAFQGISEAIGNLQTRQLKQYGIIIDTKTANENYAKAIGTTVDALTEAQQREALRNAVLEKSKDVVGAAGNAALTAAEKYKRLEVAIGNTVDRFKEAASDGLVPLLDHGEAVNVMLSKNTDESTKLTAAQTLLTQGMDRLNPQYLMQAQYLDKAAQAQASLGMTTEEKAVRAAMNQVRALDETSDATRQAMVVTNAYGMIQASIAEKLEKVNKAAQDAADQGLAMLRLSMAGAIQNENKQYLTQQDDLATKAAKLKDEIDKLSASQGRAVVSTSKATMTDTERAATLAKLAVVNEDLATAQKKQGETDLEFQSRMANSAMSAEDLRGKLDGATSAVTGYIDNSKRISELTGQYDDVNKEIEANAAKHEDATHRILFGYAEQELAADGLTANEIGALDRLAVAWNLKSQEDINAIQNIRGAAAGLATDGNIDKFIDQVVVGMPPARVAFEAQAAAMQHMYDTAKPLATQTDTADFSKSAINDLDPAKKAFDDQAKAIEAVYDKTVPLASQTNTKSFSTAVVRDMAPAKEAMDKAVVSAGDLKNAIFLLQSKTIVITTKFETVGNPPQGGSTGQSTVPGRAAGGPTGAGGLYMLHPNEWVLSEAQRYGREQIPAEALPLSSVVGTGPRVLNQYQNNFYNTLATTMYLEQQRLDQIRSVEEAM